MPNEPVDLAKLDPVLQAYLFDMRETLKKTRGEVTATAAERDALKKELEELKATASQLKKAQQPPNQPARSVRDMAEKEYRQTMRDMRKELRLKEYDQKLTRITPKEGWKDVKNMSPEEYKEYKMRVTGRKAW